MYRILLFTVLLMSSVMGVFAQEDSEHIQYAGDGFSMQYPDRWELSETDEQVQLHFEDYMLTIHTAEVRMGVSAGEFERRKLIGQYGIPVDVLVYEDNIKQVLYGRLETPDMKLTIVLSVEAGRDVDYDEIDIPQMIVDDASMIVSSIVLDTVDSQDIVVIPFFNGEINPIDNWEVYAHPAQPFGFRYPDTWTIQESADRLTLSRDDVQFVITYASIVDAPPVADADLMQSSNMQIRVPVYGMSQAILSQAVDPDEAGAGAVIYSPVSTADNYFTMWITHNDGGLVDWATIDDVDAIINTFQMRPQPATGEASRTMNSASSQMFIHSTLRFALEVPAGWTVQETTTGVVLSQNTLNLLITTTPPNGLPAGDRITFSSITLDTGIDVRRDHIVYQGRIKSAIYNYQGIDRIPVGDLELVILLTDTNADYEAIDLPDETITAIDQIVATLGAI